MDVSRSHVLFFRHLLFRSCEVFGGTKALRNPFFEKKGETKMQVALRQSRILDVLSLLDMSYFHLGAKVPNRYRAKMIPTTSFEHLVEHGSSSRSRDDLKWIIGCFRFIFCDSEVDIWSFLGVEPYWFPRGFFCHFRVPFWHWGSVLRHSGSIVGRVCFHFGAIGFPFGPLGSTRLVFCYPYAYSLKTFIYGSPSMSKIENWSQQTSTNNWTNTRSTSNEKSMQNRCEEMTEKHKNGEVESCITTVLHCKSYTFIRSADSGNNWKCNPTSRKPA